MTVTIANPIERASTLEVWSRILHYLFITGLILYFFALLLSVFFFITAGGDPRRVGTAKKIFLYSTLGFVIIVLSPGLFNFFVRIFR